MPFRPSSDIRQGDPLSPYLFILCLNHLSLSLDQALHTKQLSPIRVGRRPIGFDYILFADDIFLFAKENLQECTPLFNLFLSFCEVLGQICNATKSKLFFSQNTPLDIDRSISSFTNMPIVQDLGKYLGMPLLTKRKLTPAFQPLLDEIHTRIHVWQSKLLSQESRLTLIKFVLSPHTYYQMQTIVLPRDTTSSIDRVIRDFLWGDTPTQQHVHLIKWGTLTKPKTYGELGIKDSNTTNDAFLKN